MDLLSIHIKSFNNRIKVMNQTRAKELVLSADDARNLHNDLFDVLSQLTALLETKSTEELSNKIDFDGGKF